MEEIRDELNSKVTINNLCSPEIIKLSMKLDEKVVIEQKKLMRGIN